MVLQTFGNGMHRTKLIEVALPLDAINEESERDKKLSSGHPTTLHYWWAPRPLAACRAVVFSSLVDDPSAQIGRASCRARVYRSVVAVSLTKATRTPRFVM